MDAATDGHRNLRRSRYGLRAAVALLMGLALAGRLSAATEPASSSTERVLEEVVIEGMAAWQLQQAILETEDRFFALYNELNKDRDYDVRCANEAPLGTRLKRRICRVQFFEDAEAAQARAFLTGEYAPSPEMVMLERQARKACIHTGQIQQMRGFTPMLPQEENLEILGRFRLSRLILAIKQLPIQAGFSRIMRNGGLLQQRICAGAQFSIE